MQRAHLLSTLARRESIAKNCNCVRYLLGSTLEALAGRSRSEQTTETIVGPASAEMFGHVSYEKTACRAAAVRQGVGHVPVA